MSSKESKELKYQLRVSYFFLIPKMSRPRQIIFDFCIKMACRLGGAKMDGGDYKFLDPNHYTNREG